MRLYFALTEINFEYYLLFLLKTKKAMGAQKLREELHLCINQADERFLKMG